MSQPDQPKAVTEFNESALAELAWAIDASVGEFKLFLARCNYTSVRSHLIKRLQELTSVEIQILQLSASEKTLYAKIQQAVAEKQPDALMVLGLELVGDLQPMLPSINQVREEFRKHFHFPLIIWVNDEIYKQLLRLAPDFESWATTTEFVVATEQLIAFLKQHSQQFFTGNLTLNSATCREIKLICHQLQIPESELNLEIQACLESLFGLAESVDENQGNLDAALEHYQKALAVWQQVPDVLWQGKILNQIGFCYQLKAIRNRGNHHQGNWQAAQHYFQQSLEVFEQAQRLDLAADSILNLGNVLRQLQDWEPLAALSEKVLPLHQTANESLKIAQDYGFLAEAALGRKKWIDAQKFAQQALEILEKIPNYELLKIGDESAAISTQSSVAYHVSRYRFILAQAQENLNQILAAIANLEIAKFIGSPEQDTQLYLEILWNLQRLYFEQEKEYLLAFEIKQKRESIEQQYGLRAFVGAGWLQPQRAEKIALTQGNQTKTIAPEITVFGRQLDVEHLQTKIGRPDCKVLVIHGESGVGKSSLVYGGLVPALKQQVIGTADVLPVAMRVYTNWVEELAKILAETLLKQGIKVANSLDSGAAILEQLQENERYNLRTILIFDQFEEFFFVYSHPEQRQVFFEFLGACLKILSVKVILSLREDYLHYLLEAERLPSMKVIGNDFLAKNVRYPLGNFTAEDAKAIIKRLTERSHFQLEPDLIDALVQDLAGELNAVRPIELQIVGAQLQTENITTLAEYEQCGQKPALIQRYLAAVVKDCGAENQQMAEAVLFLLTDEKGTRPLKTRTEIERDLTAWVSDLMAETEKLDLVLKILVGSGLVLLIPENPVDRYQLVHDYLAALVRQQQQPKFDQLMAELEQEKKQRKLSEAELSRLLKQQLRRAIGVVFVLAIGTASAVGFALQSQAQRKRAEVNEINALRAAAETLLASNQNLDALVESLKAGKKLQQAPWVNTQTRNQVVGTLQLAAYRVTERNRFKSHQGDLTSVSFSLNGRQLATLGRDGTVQLWNLSGQQLAQFKHDQGDVTSASFSPNAQQLATLGRDGTVRLWNLSGQPLAEFNGHQGPVWSVRFSPSSQQLATAGLDGTMRLWDLSGQPLAEFNGHQGPVTSVSFSPSSHQLATASWDGTVRLWDLSGQQLAQFNGHQGIINDVSFSPNGQQLATASWDGTARLWDLSGQPLAEFKHDQGDVTSVSFSVTSVSFSPNGRQLVTRGEDGTARLWDLSGQPLAEFKGHQAYVTSVSFSPNGQQLATASRDGTARLWDLSGQQLAQFKAHQAYVTRVSFSPNGQQLATASWDGTARLWDLSGQLLAEFKGHQGSLTSVSFSPNGQQLVTRGEDGTARLWDLSGQPLAEFKGDQDRVTSVSFSPNGQQLATAGLDGTARLWDLSSQPLAEFKGHQGIINDVTFSPNGQQLATASEDGTARLWDLSGQQLAEFKGHQGDVTSVSFSPNGQQLATASEDGTARLWDLSGQPLAEFKGHQGIINDVSFSPNGQQLATASEDGTARLWDLSGQPLAEFKGHQGDVTSVSFSPNAQQLVTASEDGTARLWDLSGQRLVEFKGHQGDVTSMSFSPNAQQLATAGGDGTVKLWQIEGLEQLMIRGCNWARDYLKHGLDVEEGDRSICDDIPRK